MWTCETKNCLPHIHQTSSNKTAVFIFRCCVANCHSLATWKNARLLFKPQRWGIEAWLSGSLGKATNKILTRAKFLSGSSTREGSATKLIQLLAEFISLKLSDLRTCCLLVISRRSPYTPGDCPLFPMAWPSTQAAHNMTGCCFKARQRTRENLLAIQSI